MSPTAGTAHSTSTTGPTVSGLRALRLTTTLGFPSVAAGVIARRPRSMALLERFGADASAVHALRQLRAEHGTGPLQVELPGRRLAVVLDPADVSRVLEDSPDPFDPATREKKGALSPFQPHGVLISQGHIRAERRKLNEEALDTPRTLHHLAEPIVEIVDREVGALVESALRSGSLGSDEFTRAWWRIVRQVVLGPSAADDTGITDRLKKLRANGNWSYFIPERNRLRDRFIEDLYRCVDRAEPGSLAGALAALPAGGATDPVGQIPHWLFAFDAAGIASIRALALFAGHPGQREAARAEIAGSDSGTPQPYPYLRAAVLESLRLWPTTPMILRDSTRDTVWGPEGERFTIPAGTGFAILTAGFHRDSDRVPFANEFVPEAWLDGRAESYPALVPFSAGPAVCPGRNLVLLVTSTVLARLLDAADFRVVSDPAPAPDGPLPNTFDNFGVQFEVARTTGAPR
ncbi:cytochrome P450 [Rhodococcus phenolicus]|uniref:cytochrome P450 n=1 Tax=Rhodococcus phenolicus TaxID=263849 RepID=UPI00083426F9|nr:cytochrome P450 [Rhodococcus phenolicus]